MIFFTLARKEQLANAIVLAQSVKAFHPTDRMILCLVEHHVPAKHTSSFDDVVLITNQGVTPDSDESLCAAKGYFVKHVLENYHDDKFVYLDPFVKVYSPFHEVSHLLDHHEIVAVPYHLEPFDADDCKWEIERLNQGFLHAGFLALRKSETSLRFVEWWSQRISQSFFGPYKENFADHKWLSLGMAPFRIHLLKDPAYHVAAWNLHEDGRRLEVAADGSYMTSGRTLRSMCFANPGGLMEQRLARFVPDPSSPVYTVLHAYAEERERKFHTLP